MLAGAHIDGQRRAGLLRDGDRGKVVPNTSRRGNDRQLQSSVPWEQRT
jgi:hypothetical protein